MSFGQETDEETSYGQGLKSMALAQYEAAWGHLLPLAYEGHEGAQYYIGMMYLRGEGVRRNACAAITWIDRAARNGFPPAQLTMSEALSDIIWGLTPDYKRAYGWLLMAIKNGIDDPARNTNAGTNQIKMHIDKRRHALSFAEIKDVEAEVKEGRFDLETPVDVFIIPYVDARYFADTVPFLPVCEGKL